LRLRVRLRSRPCRGTVTFVVKTERRPFVYVRPVKRDPCRAAEVARLRLAPGAGVRVSATFNGNADLKPRTGPTVRYRVK
ncbi:MAG: hypothetical protein ACRDLN_02230, partial [Solirubrobacteraceae bacterium]